MKNTRIIDLSVTITNDTPSEEVAPKISYINHKTGALMLGLGLAWKGDNFLAKFIRLMKYCFTGKLIKPGDFPEGIGLSTEKVVLSTHNGTHVDSFYHYGPGLAGIDQADLNLFYSDGVLLNFKTKSPSSAITKADIIGKLTEINYDLKPFDIVLLWTGADKLWGKKEYLFEYAGLSVEALDFLIEKGVSVIGTDGFGLDKPFDVMEKEFHENGRDPKALWPVHLYGRIKNYFMIEKLTNLEKIGVNFGFKVISFPVKLKGTSAGWSRTVAVIEE